MVMSTLEQKKEKRQKKVMYVHIHDGYMNVFTRSEGLSSRRRERNKTTCHHAVTVPQYVEEGLRVYNLGVVGSNCLCVRLLSYMHLDTGGCIISSLTTVASNLDHNLHKCRWLFEKYVFKSLYVEQIAHIGS